MRRFLTGLLVFVWVVASWGRRESHGAVERDQPAGSLEPGQTRLGVAGGAGGGRLKRWLWHTAILIALLAVGGFGIAVSGIIPIKASSGHWAITQWFLDFSKGRSLATHTLGVQAPPLDDHRLVLKGAGHYETGCRGCHGSPSLRHPRVAQAMLPRPPYLPETVPEWEAEELFYMVKHGIKFTGMPAWPTQQRDDEVWAMVAFLQRYPELDAEQYQQLVHGTTDENSSVPPLESLLEPDSGAQEGSGAEAIPQAVIDSCARCHGRAGEGRGEGAFPRLAGQRVVYLRASLEAFAQGTRHSGIMEPVAAGLSPTEIDELAGYYGGLDSNAPKPSTAAQPEPPTAESPTAKPTTAEPATAEAVARGASIARQGVPAHKVPACVHCHGPSEHAHNPLYPILAGQSAEYLALQLELFKGQHRGGSPYAHIMEEVASQLSETEIRDVTLYYQSLDSSSEAARFETP